MGCVWGGGRWCIHTEGGAHTRRSVATAGVLLFKGGAGAGARVERSEPRWWGEVGGGLGGRLHAYYFTILLSVVCF